MRVTRAFFGAFGAGISLAIASSLALLLVSSVIAFNGWPDDLSESSVPDAAELSEPSVQAQGDRAVAVSLPPAIASTGSSRARRTARGSGRAGAAAGQATESSTTAPVVVPGGQDITYGTAPAEAGGSAPVANAKGDPVTTVTNSVAGATQTVTETVAPVVSGALESVGAGGPDSKSGSVVDQAAQAVGAAVELLP